MSMRYKGGRISATPPTTSQSSASGVWTLEQQLQANASGAWPGPPNYIEDVFSTYLYTGNGSTQTITNGIDLSGKGGLVWMKGRSGATDHALYDTGRGATFDLVSNSSAAQTTQSTGLTSFGSTGFSIGALAKINTNAATYASWTFREQTKFFDVVTYTGNAVAGRTVAHNLGSVPGCIIIKRTDNIENWAVYHRSLGNTASLALNLTSASGAGFWNNTTPTSTVFTLGTAGQVNDNGSAYVAYLFAHDAGGFGAAGTDNVISCGSYTGNGSTTGPTVTLNYEPQWIMIKRTDTAGTDWWMFDNMRGLTMGADADLRANLTQAEEAVVNNINPTATGFSLQSTTAAVNASGGTYIYIAIRRGPMRTPTSGTSVFGLSARTGTGANATVTGGQTDDAVLIKNRGAAVGDLFASRLTGTGYLETSSTAAEVAAGTTILQANPWDVMEGVKVGTTSTITNASANTFINYLFRRAPGFFDVVCYTGTGSGNLTLSHNLTVPPELFITKARNDVDSWQVYWNQQRANLNLNFAFSSDPYTAPTATQFTVLSYSNTAKNHVAYLFATLAGVSKVGSYTGTGTTSVKQVDCGFTGGARFVLIKRTDSTGDWYVWDTARGIVSGNDPYLLLNSTAAEVTTTDWVDTYSLGFELSTASGNDVNINNATYIFLAIA